MGYPVPVAATWTVAIEELDNSFAVMLLRLWAFFGPELILIDLIGSDTAPVLPSGLAAVAADPLARGRLTGVRAGIPALDTAAISATAALSFPLGIPAVGLPQMMGTREAEPEH